MAALLLAACSQPDKKTALPSSSEPIPVTLAPVQQTTLSGSVQATGLLYTEDESKLSFKIGGVVESVLVDEGDYVKAGQVLATLKNTEIASQVEQVQLGVQKAQRDYDRVNNLYRDSVATLEQLQNAKTGLDIARQSLDAAKFNQQYARIYAPASGFVVKKLVSAGEIAGPGMPVLVLNLVSGNSSWVLRTGVTDAQWAAIEQGNKSEVQFDAFPGKTFTATVSNKSLAADPASGSFTVELRVAFEGEKPATGMFGKATIYTGASMGAATVPYAALLEADGTTGYLFVTTDGKKVKRVAVQLGRMLTNQVEIISGLDSNMQVVVAGSAYLNERSVITVNK